MTTKARSKYFDILVVDECNQQPEEVVEAESLSTFNGERADAWSSVF